MQGPGSTRFQQSVSIPAIPAPVKWQRQWKGKEKTEQKKEVGTEKKQLNRMSTKTFLNIYVCIWLKKGVANSHTTNPQDKRNEADGAGLSTAPVSCSGLVPLDFLLLREITETRICP